MKFGSCPTPPWREQYCTSDCVASAGVRELNCDCVDQQISVHDGSARWNGGVQRGFVILRDKLGGVIINIISFGLLGEAAQDILEKPENHY